MSDPIQDAIDAPDDALIVVVAGETPPPPEMAPPRWDPAGFGHAYLVGEHGPEILRRSPSNFWIGEADETTAP